MKTGDDRLALDQQAEIGSSTTYPGPELREDNVEANATRCDSLSQCAEYDIRLRAFSDRPRPPTATATFSRAANS